MTDSATSEQLYERDTLLSTLPAPAQPVGKVFLGWYYDEEYLKPVTANDRLAGGNRQNFQFEPIDPGED